jgi:hypothetical protein
VETAPQGLFWQAGLFDLQLASFVEHPLLEVLAFVIVTGLLAVLGQWLGVSHRFPGVVEEVLACSALGHRAFKQGGVGLPLLLLRQDQRLSLLPYVLRWRLFGRAFEIGRHDFSELVWKLSVASELVRHGVVVRGARVGIRSEVEESRIGLRLLVAAIVVDEATEIGRELGAKGAIGVDVHGFPLLVKQEVLAAFYVIAVS